LDTKSVLNRKKRDFSIESVIYGRIVRRFIKEHDMSQDDKGKPEGTPGQGPPEQPGGPGKPPHQPPGPPDKVPPVDPPRPPKHREVG